MQRHVSILQPDGFRRPVNLGFLNPHNYSTVRFKENRGVRRALSGDFNKEREVKAVGAGPSMQRTRLHPLCAVTARQLVALTDGTPLLEIGKPIGKIEQIPRGEDGRERRSVWVGLSIKGKTETSWPVGTRKEIQVRNKGSWVTERVVG